MARYNILEAGFSSLDETINFGMRAMADNTNLYEIVTVAVIRSSETNTISDQLKVVSQYLDERIFFSTDKILRILKNKNVSDQIGSFEFDYIIDTFCVSLCGRFILICTQDGNIAIRDLSCSFSNDDKNSVEFPVVFEETLKDCYSGECYFIGSFFNESSFYVVTSNGLIKKIVLSTDTDSNELFTSEIVFNFKSHVNICAFEYPNLCLEGSELHLLNVNTKTCQTDDAIGLKSIQAMGTYFFAYDNMGNTYRICSNELLTFCLNQKFPDIVGHFDDLLLSNNGEKKSKVYLLGTTKNLPEKKKEIKLMTYSELDVVYNIPLEGPVHIINNKDLSEDVLFLTEICVNRILSEIRLQIIVKADPEVRLSKLIQKQLFDEAEVFAQTFNVSPEVIAKAKARLIKNKTICTSKDIDQLFGILNTVDDQLFKLECCETVDCELGTDTRRVLCYGAFMDITVKDCNKNKDNVLLVKKMDFNDKVHRFDTFMQLCGNYDHRKWKDFAECDLIDEIKILLQKGEIQGASLIFSRLDRNTVYELTPLKIEEIILMLNKDPLTNSGFLNAFIPVSLKYVPDSVGIFVKWLHDAVLQLEKQCDDFPECAIKFVEAISNLMGLSAPVKQHLHVEDLQTLTNLTQVLEDLKTLLNNYRIRFSLSEYLHNPSIFISTLLRVNCNIANFETLMKNFVCPFIFKNKLDMDRLLMEEIENLLIYEEEYWIKVVPVLLNFLTSVDNKLEVSYKILEISNMPWSKSVKDMALMTCQLEPTKPETKRIMENMSNEQIVTVLRKYNIPQTDFNTLDDKRFYFNRILYLNRESAFDDIHHLCMDDEVRREADLLIMNKLIIGHNHEKAMNIFDENSRDIIIPLGQYILSRCIQYAHSYDLPKKYRDPYFTVLYPIWNRLDRHATSVIDKRQFEWDYKIAYAIYGISEYFKIQIDPSNLMRTRKRDDLLDTLVQQTIDLYSHDSCFETFMLTCKKLATFFDINLEAVFMKCMVKSKAFNLFLRIGQHLLDSSKCSKLLSCWALYLLKYFNNGVIDDCDDTSSDVFSNVPKKDDEYLMGIKLANKLSIKAMMNATSEDHLAVMEVIRWIDSCFYLTNFSKDLNLDSLQIYPSGKPLNQGLSSIETIKSAFNTYCAILGSLVNPSMKYLTCFTANISVSEEKFEEEIERLTQNINILLREGQHLTCFNLIKTIQEGFLCNSSLSVNELRKLQTLIRTNWLPKTLEAVLSYKYIDKTLLLNLMLLCDSFEKPLWNFLHVYKRQPHKLYDIIQVGLELCKYYNNTQGTLDLINNRNLCKWWNRVKDTNINYDCFFTADDETRLPFILTKPANLVNLPEYCCDFRLDLQETYLKCLELTLTGWQPEIKKITDICGKTKIIIQNNESKLHEECKNILECITNTDAVLALIEQMLPMVNYYYYEVFTVLFSIHSKLSSKRNILFESNQKLLFFLKNYERVSSPSRSEIEQWFGTFHLKASIDPLSEFRLPLTSTFFSSDIWTIIKPEVNLQTYKYWFRIVPILKQFLNENDICIYAITSAGPTMLSGSESDNWELYPKYDHVVAKVEECVQNISNLEQATAALYTLMSNMTAGADKVKMAELAYKYAQLYRETANNEDVKIVYLKVKQRYFNYAATHILHKYQLAEDHYLKLVAQPSVLISSLYGDPRIAKHICSIHFNCPDINNTVDELCILFGLTPKKIKLDELMKLLKSGSTLDLDRNAENDSILRAYYICESSDFLKTLIKIGMNKDNLESSLSVRVNALKCFYYASDLISLETRSEMDREQFLIYTNKISVMAKLDDFGLRIKTVGELDQINKKKLFKTLAEINKPLAIKCIASICKIYELDDLKYWEFIVNSSIQFNLVNDLRDYVEYLRFRCVKDFIKKAWNVVITGAFKTEENYITALRLLQTCPVIYALPLEDYIEKCISNKRPEIAAMLLEYISMEKQKVYLKVILSRKNIIEDVAGLENKGILRTDKAIQILESSCKLGSKK